MVTTPSGLEVFTSLVGLPTPKLAPEKSQWEVTTPSVVQAFTSLVGVRAAKLDLEKSQWEVTTPKWSSSLPFTCGHVSSQVGP